MGEWFTIEQIDDKTYAISEYGHWDHIGGHNLFDDIYVHKDDAEWLQNGITVPLSVIKKSIMQEPFYKKPPMEFNIEDYKIYTGDPTRILNDNDIIDIGSRKIKIIHTPGHSPGHICLFEEEKGYLYTGDLVYKGTLYAFYPSTDPILFKQSIDKVSSLKGVIKILPAHNELDIQVDLVGRVKNAFKDIDDKNMLKQGNGVFDFGDFNIHI